MIRWLGSCRKPPSRKTARRFIGVNVIYNRLWPVFTDYVATNINPFCVQVLAGHANIDTSTTRGKVLRFRGSYGIRRRALRSPEGPPRQRL